MADLLSQIAVEVLEGPAPSNALVSQVAVEVLEAPGLSNALLSQIAIEVLEGSAPPVPSNALVSQFAIEVLESSDPSGSINLCDTNPMPPAGQPYVHWQSDHATPRNISAFLPVFGGDAGSGGMAGSVPAPKAGDAAIPKFLRADGSWAAGVSGPAGATGQPGQPGATGATGAQGPAGSPGATGASGAQGPQGVQGVAGSNGNTVWNGTSAPASSLGQNGDFYLNTATETLYGPKAGGAWPSTGTSLIGPQGATGQTGASGAQGPQGVQGVAGSNGNTIWNGTSTPASSLGQNGDFYLNTATETLYGPKASGAWPSAGTSLIGPQGVTGQTGQTGATGATGAQGPAGAQGSAGATGATGAQGPQGVQGVAGSNGNTVWNGTSTPASSLGQNGDFYLNTATETLYGPKASGAWPSTGTSLIGPQGAAGQAGQTGATGGQGAAGATGPTGATGAQGAQGSPGVAGSNGNTIWNGTGTPASSLGQNGDFYLNTATEMLYGPKASGAWPSTGTSLIGPQGPTGFTGPPGANGTNGNTIWSGNAAPPPNTLGQNGDFYLYTVFDYLYGPKANGVWPSSFTSLVGVAGANGNTIWNGTSTPASSLGQNGDFYLNTTTETLFGPKASGAWPSSGTSLIGPAGAQGPAGPLPPVRKVTASSTATVADGTILVDATNGAVTITTPASPTANQWLNVKKLDATANAVTLAGNGSTTVEGQSTALITLKGMSLEIVWDGSAWWVI